MSKKRSIVFIDGSQGDEGDFPVAVVYNQIISQGQNDSIDNYVVDPIFNGKLYNNLYGRLMTLIEATTEQYKLQSVKDLFGKELSEWQNSVHVGAREIATMDTEQKGGIAPPPYNIYTK